VLLLHASNCQLIVRWCRRLATTAAPAALAFLVGAAGMVLGALVAWQLVAPLMGHNGPKLASCLCASYIGGSVNFAAVAKVRGGALVLSSNLTG
jgi:uncharacterized membrane protein